MSRVILKPTLADNMKRNDHVVVTTNDIGGESVTWAKVDKEELEDSTNRVPSSKIVAGISAEVDALGEDYGTLSTSISSLQVSASVLSSGLSQITDGATGKLNKISTDLTEMSSSLSALFNHSSTRFIGVSETDPATGIITIDGVKYVISSDFDESNNGDIVFYKTTVLNHSQSEFAGRPATQDNTEEDIHHEPISAITMLYAYIYANGVLNDYTSVEIAENPDEEEPTGSFQKYGYAFFQNLSTLIHDADVCDFAAIQQKKILGLTADLQALRNKDTSLQSQITTNKNSITSIAADLDNVKTTYATKQYVHNISNDLSTKVNTDFATKAYVNQKDNEVREGYIAADSTLNSSLQTFATAKANALSACIKDYYISCSNILTGNNAYAGATSNNTKVIGANYATSLINQRMLSSKIVTSLPNANDSSTTYVPSMAIFQQLSTAVTNALAQLASSMAANMEPEIGTLKFIVNKNKNINSINNTITSDSFDGWAVPNGATIAIGSGDFPKSGPFKSGNSIVLPNFTELYMRMATATKQTFAKLDGHSTLPAHYHSLTDIKTKSQTLTINASVPGGSKSGSKGIHTGWNYETDFKINISNVTIPALSLADGSKTTSTGNDNDVPQPNHVDIPVLIYIGKKKY